MAPFEAPVALMAGSMTAVSSRRRVATGRFYRAASESPHVTFRLEEIYHRAPLAAPVSRY